MKISMTTRRWLVVIGLVALGMWTAIALGRTLPLRPHLLPSRTIPGVFEYSPCPYRPYWSKFWRTFLGKPWPGNFVCPNHPKSPYIEDQSSVDSGWWWWRDREARTRAGRPAIVMVKRSPAPAQRLGLFHRRAIRGSNCPRLAYLLWYAAADWGLTG
jgi:hypothetical protein